MKMTPKIRNFIQAYDGDNVSSMRVAGYEGSDTYLNAKCKELLANPVVKKGLESRDKYNTSRLNMVADRQERQAFWTDLMRNHDPDATIEYDSNNLPKPMQVPLAARLKASELLGRSEADFTDKVSVDGNITITDIIKDSYRISESGAEDDIEAIEAQYKMLKGLEDSEGDTLIEDHDVRAESPEVPDLSMFL
jgi:hypothetical protein